MTSLFQVSIKSTMLNISSIFKPHEVAIKLTVPHESANNKYSFPPTDYIHSGV